MFASRPPGGFLLGLIGSGISTSLSPALHERAADELGVRYLYRTLDLETMAATTSIGELLAATRLAGYDGLNITHPCKQAVTQHLDELAAEAAALGAVNTVLFTEGKAIGHNTDSAGFARAMRLGLPDVRLDRVVVLGAGGAGAAVAHALLASGAGQLRLFDHQHIRAAELARTLCGSFGSERAVAGTLDDDELARALRPADGLVHATPTGMATHPGLPLPARLVSPDRWLAEVVYRPLRTRLVRTARERGCRTLDGGTMAVFQAVEAFRLFTGHTPDAERMLRHFNEIAEHPALEGTAHVS